MEFLRSLGERHERLKKKIHSTRIPLSKNGQRFMAAVYFSIPVVSGYYIMQWAQGRADANFLKEEDKIRGAGGSSAKYIKQQNAQLREMLADSAATSKKDGA